MVAHIERHNHDLGLLEIGANGAHRTQSFDDLAHQDDLIVIVGCVIARSVSAIEHDAFGPESANPLAVAVLTNKSLTDNRAD